LDPRRDEWTTYILAEPNTPETPPAAGNNSDSSPEESVSAEKEEEVVVSKPPVANGVRFKIEGLKNGEPISLTPRGSTSSPEEESKKTPDENSESCGD
jgi:hypothetical protein